MAAPYILVGFRPSLMRFLPKPGPSMSTFKQMMGFVLIATVLWLMLPIDAPLLRPTLVLLAGLAAACWWIGRTPGYAELSEKLKAWGQATAFTAIVGWLAFAMPQFTDPLPWREFTMSKFVGDVNSGKTVLVEFTAIGVRLAKHLKQPIWIDRKLKLRSSKTMSSCTKSTSTIFPGRTRILHAHAAQPRRSIDCHLPAGKKYQPISFGNGYTQSQILQALKEAGPSEVTTR